MNDETQQIAPVTETTEAQGAQLQPEPDTPIEEPPALRIVKREFCASISGRSTLTYHIGIDSLQIPHLRIFANTGKGMWSKAWIPMASILDIVANASEESPLTSGTLQILFAGKSINTAGFLLAVLSNEGLIHNVPDSVRSYQHNKANTFSADIQALIDAGVALDAQPAVKPAKPPKATKKPARKAKGS